MGYLTGLLCAVWYIWTSGEVRRGERVVTMVEGQNQERCPLKRASRLQNSEIEVRGEAGVPRRSHSDAQVSKLKFFCQERRLALCKLGF